MGGSRYGLSARRALGGTLLALCAVAVAAAGQPQGQPQPPVVPDPATASIAGRLLDATTLEPIAGGVLVLRALASRDQRVLNTSETGEFAFLDLPAATYALHATAVGYVGRQYGQHHVLEEGGTPITLQAGETRRQLDMALPPAGVITGRVATPDGQPVAAAEVEALRPQLENNVRVLVPVGRAESNARGDYRIIGLPPGHYYVAAIDPTDEGSTDATGQIRWAQTFFPGSSTAAAAERVRLLSGATLTGVDFPMRAVSRVSVRGQLFNPDEGELATGSVIMSPESDDGLALGLAQAALVRPDGTFEFTNVTPGRYRLRASARTILPGPALFASFQLEVRDTDLANALLLLSRGANLFGQVEIADGASAPPPVMTDIWVSAPMADGSMGSGLTRSQVLGDRSFSLATPVGDRVIRVEHLPAPWSLDSVFYQGRNVIDVPFELQSGEERQRIRLVLTDRASRLVGVVQDENGNVITDRAVVALPRNATFWRTGSRHIKLAYPDLSGRFEIIGLPAGVYFVAAITGIHDSDLYDQAVFQEIAAAGTEVLVEAGETTTMDLILALGGSRLAN